MNISFQNHTILNNISRSICIRTPSTQPSAQVSLQSLVRTEVRGCRTPNTFRLEESAVAENYEQWLSSPRLLVLHEGGGESKEDGLEQERRGSVPHVFRWTRVPVEQLTEYFKFPAPPRFVLLLCLLLPSFILFSEGVLIRNKRLRPVAEKLKRMTIKGWRRFASSATNLNSREGNIFIFLGESVKGEEWNLNNGVVMN